MTTPNVPTNRPIETPEESRINAKQQLAELKNQIEATKEAVPTSNETPDQKRERILTQARTLQSKINAKINELKQKFPSATGQLDAFRIALINKGISILEGTQVGQLKNELNTLRNGKSVDATNLDQTLKEAGDAIDIAQPAVVPASTTQETPEEEVEEGGFAGGLKKVMKGIERVQEAIQSVGAAALEQLAKILKMLGMDKWANAIMEYVAGADMAHLKDALDANGVKMIDPRTAEEPDAAAAKEFLADRKALFDSFGAVSKYTRKQYYAAVLKAWKAKAENQGRNEATPAELLAVARDVPKENPTPTPEPKKVEKPEDYPTIDVLQPVDLMKDTQKVNIEGQIVGIRVLPNGVIELSRDRQTTIQRKISPKQILADAKPESPVEVVINSAQWTAEGLVLNYSQKYTKTDETSGLTGDTKTVNKIQMNQFLKNAISGASVASYSADAFEFKMNS